MRLASFNVENMFDRAKAMNQESWAEGRPALAAHAELNRLFNKATYTAADKARILDLLEAQGLLKQDEGTFLILRRIRGKLVHRPKNGAVTVEATGRASWVGWVDLKTEHVKVKATENCARVIKEVNADVLGVIEAEDRITLNRFNTQLLPAVGGTPYPHVMLIDGNDDRGIDVGIMTRSTYPILSIRSHIHDRDADGIIFSRDCAEYEIGLPSGDSLFVLINHFKSKGYGAQAANDAKRLRQARRVREIVDTHLAAGHKNIVVIGDLNDTPDRAPLAPLLAGSSPLKDIAQFAGIQDGGRPGTHGNCTASSKIDYILLSPNVFQKLTAAGIERRGMWGGKSGTLWPRFPEVDDEMHAGSDHAAIWAEFTA
jgi:endonuclease/exonuclease/phosphatase family metal-dependent hydrolase